MGVVPAGLPCRLQPPALRFRGASSARQPLLRVVAEGSFVTGQVFFN